MSNEVSDVKIAGLDIKILLHDMMQTAQRTLAFLIALVVVCSGVLCWNVHRSYRPVYRAQATFTVYVINPLQAEIRSYNTATAEQMAKTFPYILTSGALSDTVMRELGLSSMPSVTASVLSSTNIFTLSVTASQPQLAYDVLNAVIKYYPEVAEFVVGPTVMNLLDESGVPTQPANSKNYSAPLKKGILIGAAIWALIVVGLTALRSTIHNEDELKTILNIRSLGILPAVKGLNRQKGAVCPLINDGMEHYGFGESVRLMQLRTEKELREHNIKVLLVSSATPGEGKTTVALNLATALAAKGCRTLLIDCDLRNPSVAKNLRQENSCGMVEYIRGQVPYQKIIHPGADENLYLVYAGGPAGDASELLAKPACKAFVDACRKVFDYIILDTPPAALLSDASEAAILADGALLTIRQDYASRNQILEGTQLLADSGTPIIGCVINYATGVLSGGSYYGGYGNSKYYRNYTDREKGEK